MQERFRLYILSTSVRSTFYYLCVNDYIVAQQSCQSQIRIWVQMSLLYKKVKPNSSQITTFQEPQSGLKWKLAQPLRLYFLTKINLTRNRHKLSHMYVHVGIKLIQLVKQVRLDSVLNKWSSTNLPFKSHRALSPFNGFYESYV